MADDEELFTELSDSEKEWWAKLIKEFRGRLIKEPKEYALSILKKNASAKDNLLEHSDELIKSTREAVWRLYLKDEYVFHAEIIEHLVKNRDLPKRLLANLVYSSGLSGRLTKQGLLEDMAKVIGKYSGNIMPFIYDLSLSTTQSRRSRAGVVFEQIIESFMEILGIKYENQSSLGNTFFTEHDLGKKVDLIIPGAKEYVRNRSKCMLVTLKTSLRERWQEVAEEIARTGIPNIFLLTADEGVSLQTMQTMGRYNIRAVVYESEKQKKFSNINNVIDFKTFFKNEVPNCLDYWEKA